MFIVQKFGGTSVGSAQRIRAVAARVAKRVQAGDQVVVVVSAMGHSTDELVGLSQAVSSTRNNREMDALLATGEQVSTALLAMALQDLGVEAASFTGWQAGVRTEPVHGAARIEAIDPQPVRTYVDGGGVPVVAGFQGIAAGAVTTLGRGGSDTTAVALTAALKADLCEIYTDVDGVYTADPRMVATARKLTDISYEEMLELANLGTQVLHPRAVETAKRHGVNVVVRTSFADTEGTVITDMASMEGLRVVTGVAFEKEVARIALVGMPRSERQLADVFTALADSQVNVDVIVQSVVKSETVDVSFTVQEADVERTLAICERSRERIAYKELLHETGLSKISIVGAGMISNPGVAAQMFAALEAVSAQVWMVSTSEIKVSCVIDQRHLKSALDSVHESFALHQE
ncbi:MAG: aspartate kinase [Firmicutes bacterium]|nr:aspartate kinase [Bacillota bacterium]